MGQRQDKTEIEYGDDCLTCFEPGKTPLYAYARFSKIIKCTIGEPDLCKTPPNDKVFKLTQFAEEPCVWRHIGTYWRVFFRIAGAPPGENYLLLDTPAMLAYFRAFFDDCIEEGQVLHNVNPACNGLYCGTGGIGVVTWRLETLKVMGLI